MKTYNCGHSHNAVHYNRRDGHEIYDLYIKWKYTVGYGGTKEMCWNCYRLKLGKDI
jgi:hypothetical protein